MTRQERTWGTKPRSPAGSGGGAACDTARELEVVTLAKWAGSVDVQNCVSPSAPACVLAGEAGSIARVVGSSRGAAPPPRRLASRAGQGYTSFAQGLAPQKLTGRVAEHEDVSQHVARPLLGREPGGRDGGGGRQQAVLVDKGDQDDALPLGACGRRGWAELLRPCVKPGLGRSAHIRECLSAARCKFQPLFQPVSTSLTLALQVHLEVGGIKVDERRGRVAHERAVRIRQQPVAAGLLEGARGRGAAEDGRVSGVPPAAGTGQSSPAQLRACTPPAARTCSTAAPPAAARRAGRACRS